MSRLDLVFGPNGAGKSTFVEFVLAEARPGVVFVNADVIAAERWPDNPLPHAYGAARAAQDVRDALIAAKESFIAGPGPVTVATFVAGVPVGDPRWPEWIPGPLRQRWPTTRR